MREILFRGKRKDNGEWVEGDLLTHGVDYETAIRVHNTNELGGGVVISVIPKTVGQFTGLTDLDGKKIFEGDIVEYIYEYERFIVAWDDMNACFALTIQKGGRTSYDYNNYTMDDTHELDVIGNIHDNAELLEVKE